MVKLDCKGSSGTYISPLMLTVYSPIRARSVFSGTVKSASATFYVTKTGRFVKVIVSGYPQFGYCSKAYGLTFASVADPISYVISVAKIVAMY